MLLLALALAAGAALAQQPQTIDSIRVIGNRRIPKETVLARLFTHPGDTYDPISIERDFNSLWNTGYFENLRIEREDSEKGIILDIFVKEKPTIREINYKGLNAVSQSDVLDRFKKEKVGLSPESQYDAAKILRATTVLKEILAEHGHQFAIIKLDIKDIPPASVQVNFNIKEGPTVKVGEIKFTGNQHLSGLVSAPLDEESEADRHSLLDHLRESVCADLRCLQAGGRHRAGAPGLSATRATTTPQSRSRRRRSGTRAA